MLGKSHALARSSTNTCQPQDHPIHSYSKPNPRQPKLSRANSKKKRVKHVRMRTNIGSPATVDVVCMTSERSRRKRFWVARLREKPPRASKRLRVSKEGFRASGLGRGPLFIEVSDVEAKFWKLESLHIPQTSRTSKTPHTRNVKAETRDALDPGLGESQTLSGFLERNL